MGSLIKEAVKKSLKLFPLISKLCDPSEPPEIKISSHPESES